MATHPLRLEAVLHLIQAGEPGLEALGRVRAKTNGRSLALLYPSLRKKRSLLIPTLLASLDSTKTVTIGTSLEILSALDAWDELARSLRNKNPALLAPLRDTLVLGGGAVVPALLEELARNKTASQSRCLAVMKALGNEAIPPLVQALHQVGRRKQDAAILRELTQPARPRR